jgi:tetratricopeptide (TPR) repeat protein
VGLLILAGAVLLAQPAQGSAVAGERPGERIVTATGYYAGVDEDEDGAWIRLDDTPLRFRLPRLSSAELEPFVRLVATASRRGFALRVRFDGTAGRVDTQNATVAYPLCSLSVGNVQPLGDEAANCPDAAAPSQRSSLSSLAWGLAARAHPDVAIRLLGDALGDPGLAAPVRVIALRARGEAAEALAGDQEWGGEAFDRLMIAALADYRARVAIDPDNPDALSAVGKAFSDLGAYDDALTIYETIGHRWPGEALRVATRIGAVYRQKGDYQRALAELDHYAERAGRPDGMRFAYHRAWTLVLLGRFQDAFAEIGIGLQSQPDYSSAWSLRSCARAQLGAIEEARRDQERALELLETLARDGEPGLGADISRSQHLVAVLRETRGAATAETLNEICHAPWQNWERTRPRSPLLIAGSQR